MNWEAIGAVGEILGAIGVIVTLGYLASQIRQNSKLLRASTTAASHQVQTNITTLLAQDPDANRIYWEGLEDPDALTEEERRRFDPLLTLFLQHSRQQHQFHRDGVGDPEEWTYVRQGLGWLLERPGGLEFWRAWRSTYPPQFRELVDSMAPRGEFDD